MQEPSSTAQLLDLIRSARADLAGSAAFLTDERLSEPGAAGYWSAKDILVHVTWWEQRTIEKLQGEKTAHDRLGGEDNYEVIDIVNDEVYRAYRDQPAAEARAAFHASLPSIVACLTDLGEDDVCANRDFIADNTYRHYPEHAAQIREFTARSA